MICLILRTQAKMIVPFKYLEICHTEDQDLFSIDPERIGEATFEVLCMVPGTTFLEQD